MNPLVRSYLKQIEQASEDLHAALVRNREQIERNEAAHERLMKQFWDRGKEIAVLKEGLGDYETFQEENERLKAVQEELSERLHRVLGYTKALTSEFRP